MSGALTRNQEARRRRAMDAAVALAAGGGFAAVQMRDVAAEAEIALGTLYRYFPSKEHLLVSILAEWVTSFEALEVNDPSPGDTPAERVVETFRRAMKLHVDADVVGALVKALASADPGIADLTREVNGAMTRTLTRAIHEGEPTERDLAAARLLQQVWLSALLGWIGGVEDEARVMEDLEVATRLLLDGGSPNGKARRR